MGKDQPLTIKKTGELRSIKQIEKILGKERLYNLGFESYWRKVTSRQAVMLNKAAEELPPASEVDNVDDIELQEIVRSTKDLIFQIKDVQTDTDDLFKHPLRELPGLDKQLRSIRDSLKVEVAKKVQVEECIKKEHCKLEEFRDYPRVYDDAMREDIQSGSPHSE